MKKRLLVISSSDEMVSQVKDVLLPFGYEVLNKRRLATGVKAMVSDDIILLDVHDPIDALKEIKSYHPEAVVIILGNDDCYLGAADEGAYDCLQRPIDNARLRIAVRNAVHYVSLREDLKRHVMRKPPSLTLGRNPKMSKALKQVARLAAKDIPVLIMGEKGVGKEIIARAIHQGSFRAGGIFTAVDASTEDFVHGLFGENAIPGTLLTADGGTVFLKNLRDLHGEELERFSFFLTEGKFIPEGTASHVKSDVRVICSANGIKIDPKLLRAFPSVIRIPSLRERPEDIVPLAEEFLSESADLFNISPKKLTKAASRVLIKHDWPGNIGELKNTMRRACLLAREGVVDVRHLALDDGIPYYSVKEFLNSKLKKYIKDMGKLGNACLHDTVMSEVEKSLIEIVFDEMDGNQLRTAATLGINRTTLRTKIRNYKIKKARK